jgi:hypothetical protein
VRELSFPRGRWVDGAVAAAYLAVALVYFGPRVLPHAGSDIVGNGQDPQIFAWSFAWWPHAILRGENPFYTHAIWAPDGYNLAWATTVPGLALVFSPLTLAFGPVASYDVACILMPALAAFTAFLLCRHITHATWPSLVGGYLFGFSSYLLGGTLDHIHTTAVFLVPLAALVVLRFLERELSGRGLAWRLGVILAAQMSISIEILFTLTLALLVSIVLAFAVAPALRARLRAVALPLAGAYALAAAIMSPFVYYLVTGTGFRPLKGSEIWVADALNFVLPTRVEWLGSWWTHGVASHFPTNDFERGAYIGVPALAIVCWFAARRLRTPGGRFLVVALVVSAVASLGSWLTVDGHQLISLPWEHIAYLPLLENTMPVRFPLYSSLVVAVIVALWAASNLAPANVRVGLSLLAALFLVPNLGLDAWTRSPHVPPLFTSGLVRDCFRPGETILAFPYGPRGDSMLWQADAGFRFRLAGGYISPNPPASFTTPAIQHVSTSDNPSEVTTQAVLELARLKSVDAIVVDARRSAPYRSILRGVARPREVGGALIYRLGSAAPAPVTCPRG